MSNVITVIMSNRETIQFIRIGQLEIFDRSKFGRRSFASHFIIASECESFADCAQSGATAVSYSTADK